MRLSRQFQANLFFLWKNFERTKPNQIKTNHQNKNKWIKNNKDNNFLHIETYQRGNIGCFAFLKENGSFIDNLMYYTTNSPFITWSFNPIQDGLFRGCSRMRGPKSPPSLKSGTDILQWWNLAQLYLTQRRSEKHMNHLTHPLSSADISIFSPEINKFCYVKKYRYRLYFDT